MGTSKPLTFPLHHPQKMHLHTCGMTTIYNVNGTERVERMWNKRSVGEVITQESFLEEEDLWLA